MQNGKHFGKVSECLSPVMYLSYDMAIPFLGIYSQENIYPLKDLLIVIVPLFNVAPNWKRTEVPVNRLMDN